MSFKLSALTMLCVTVLFLGSCGKKTSTTEASSDRPIDAFASRSSPSELVGEWRSNHTGLVLDPDGTYTFWVNSFGAPGGAHGNCSNTEMKRMQGNFVVNNDQMTLDQKTLTTEAVASCGSAMVAQTRNPETSNSPFTETLTFFLQNNGRELVFVTPEHTQKVYRKQLNH
jgi:hypothetical protein